MKVDLYTTHCPKCLALEKKLELKGVQYIEHTNIDEMLALGYTEVPVLKVDGQSLPFGEAIKWVNSLEG